VHTLIADTYTTAAHPFGTATWSAAGMSSLFECWTSRVRDDPAARTWGWASEYDGYTSASTHGTRR
jgi:hypothetical protein